MSHWNFLFVLTIVAIYLNCAVLPLAYLPEREITIRNNVVSFETRMDAFYFFIILLFLCFLALILITLLTDCIYSQWTKSFTTLAQDIVKEALQHDDVKDLQPLFDKTITIYFRDCGGQPEFHEVLPVLVSQSTLFLLVFNLSEGLDTQCKVTYKTSNGEVSDPYVSSFTVKQALLQMSS